jgi:hypothetical protein
VRRQIVARNGERQSVPLRRRVLLPVQTSVSSSRRILPASDNNNNLAFLTGIGPWQASVADDCAYMRAAVSLAWQYAGGTGPNPSVGCVIVDKFGAVAGRGAHARCGGPHAEVSHPRTREVFVSLLRVAVIIIIK